MITKLLEPRLPQTLRWQAWRPRCSYRPLRPRLCAELRVTDEGNSHPSRSTLDEKLQKESLPDRGFVLPLEAVNLIAERIHILLIVSILATGWQCYKASPSWALTHGWRPRRHLRRMGERDRDLHLKKGKSKRKASDTLQSSVSQSTQQVQHTLDDTKKYLTNLWKSARRKWTGTDTGEFTMTAAPLGRPLRTGRELSLDPLVGYAAGGALLVTALFFMLRAAKGLRRRATAGPGYIERRDRSLGGRVVSVPLPDPVRAAPVQSTAVVEDQRGRAAAIAAGNYAPTRAPITREEAIRSSDVPISVPSDRPVQTPDWWAAPASTYVTSRQKQEAQEDAMRILRDMEGLKLVGQDYPTTSLLALRRIIGQTGVTVKPRTDSGRDAMYRTAADMAVTSAMDPHLSELEGTAPQEFVAGLARDLGVPDEKAVVITVATVAAKARSALVSACAAYRERDMEEAMLQLLRIASVLNAFPLAPGSAEAEAVGASLQQKFSLEERQVMFLTYGSMDYPTAGILAEMLGFNPELVLPQLRAHLAARSRRPPPSV